MAEFEWIEKYFLPLSNGAKDALGFQDDAALIDVPQDMSLVVSSDMLSAATHFLPDQSSYSIAQKALRANISDMLAMGAHPYCYQLSLALPKNVNDAFLEGFCAGLADDQERYGVFLSGGDTTSTAGPLCISVSMFGHTKTGQEKRRSGACVGDHIFLSGSVGDAFCGLQMLQGAMTYKDQACIEVYKTPDLPYALLPAVQSYARAAVDISDGLLADLAHMARASGVNATVALYSLEFSVSVQSMLQQGYVKIEDLLSGGDDYQLLLAVPPEHVSAFKQAARDLGCAVQDIGIFMDGGGEVQALDEDGVPLIMKKRGWTHF